MASRIITECSGSPHFIRKWVDLEWDSPAWEIQFPRVEEVQRNTDTLMEKLQTMEDPLRQAILQQYNEILIYDAAPLQYKHMLAPQVDIDYMRTNNLPIILYPRMRPLMSEKDSENQFASLYAGWNLRNANINVQKIKEFFEELPNLCSYFGLVEEDIVNNFSNIGYNQFLGLRILDYGLCEDEIFIG